MRADMDMESSGTDDELLGAEVLLHSCHPLFVRLRVFGVKLLFPLCRSSPSASFFGQGGGGFGGWVEVGGGQGVVLGALL